jgi:hypothetical protein
VEEPFDPYRKWLGIPPEEQPPHHYRLLGIAVYEDDPDVISNAADRQMAHLRTFQTGKRGAQSQALLNEVGIAKVCLLNPESKREYDQKLRAKLVARPAAAPGSIPPGGNPPPLSTVRPVAVRPVAVRPVAVQPAPADSGEDFSTGLPGAGIPSLRRPVAATAYDEAPFEGTSFADAEFDEENSAAPAAIPQLRARPRRKAQSTSAAAVIGGIGAVVALGILAAMLLSGNRNADKSATTKTGPKESPVAPVRPDTNATPGSLVSTEKPKPAPETKDKPLANDGKSSDGKPEKVKPAPPTRDKPAEAVRPPEVVKSKPPTTDIKPTDSKSPAVKSPDVKPGDTTSAKKPAGEVPADASHDPLVVDAPKVAVRPKRPAPPAKDAIDKAYRIVRKEFSQRLSEARLPEERSEIAQEIGQKITEAADPATRYALALLKRNLALQMADAEAVCQAIDRLADYFDVDGFGMKREALDEVSTFTTLTLDDQCDLMSTLQKLARNAMTEEKSDAALGLARVAKALAARPGMRSARAFKESPELEDVVKEVDATAADATEFDRDLKGFDRAAKQLAREPNDAAANLAAGRYWGFVKHDWAKALVHFSKCNDPVWKEPATIDLTEPKEPAGQAALGDQWLMTAKRKAGIAKEPTMRRALAWYERALPRLPETARPAVQAKVNEIRAVLARSAAAAAGARKSGSSKEGAASEKPAMDKEDDKTNDNGLAPDGSALDKTKSGDDIPPSERKPIDLDTPEDLE